MNIHCGHLRRRGVFHIAIREDSNQFTASQNRQPPDIIFLHYPGSPHQRSIFINYYQIL